MSGIFRSLRRSFRAWRNRQRLKAEETRYRVAFKMRRLTIPGEAEIRAHVSSCFPCKAAKAKGSLQILAIYHDYNWEGPSLAPSLAAFGQVSYLDWSDPILAGGRQPDRDGWREAMNEGLSRTVKDLAADRPFDVIFTYLSGQQLIPETLERLRELGAPMVNLALNDKETFVGKVRNGQAAGGRDICRYFDLSWTSTIDALEKYVVEGATPFYLPEGANPDIHRPFDEDKSYDVSFVGQCYGNRPEIIGRLRAAGIRVEAFGPGWPGGPLTMEEMVRTWSRTRINLGFGGVLGHKETYCLKGRDFEIPMSGGLYLTEHHAELIPFYDVGREIVTYRGFDDLLEKIRWLLSNPEELDLIRLAGRARALREHTWEMRFDRVFRMLGVLD
jgi:glycosyltransferase involved in cell wall biosynthesis